MKNADLYALRFVRRLIEKNDEPEIISESQCDMQQFEELLVQQWLLLRGFEHTRNALDPVRAYINAIDNGVYPAEWVMQWLYQAFTEFMAGEGVVRVDERLGLKHGRNTTPAFKRDKRDENDYMLAQHIWILNHVFGASIEDAAEKVAVLVENINKASPGKLHEYGADTLADYYYRKWKIHVDVMNDSGIGDRVSSWSDAEKEQYLKQFDYAV